MLYEDTGELAFAIEDIIRPFDMQELLLLFGHIGGEGAHHCPSGEFADSKLLLTLQEI